MTQLTTWDGRAEIAVGLFIARMLAEDPPPADSAIADDLEGWSDRLRLSGERRLAALGAPLSLLPRI